MVETFSEQLHAIMILDEVNVADVAKRSGVSSYTIRKALMGENITSRTESRIAMGLELKALWVRPEREPLGLLDRSKDLKSSKNLLTQGVPLNVQLAIRHPGQS